MNYAYEFVDFDNRLKFKYILRKVCLNTDDFVYLERINIRKYYTLNNYQPKLTHVSIKNGSKY